MVRVMGNSPERVKILDLSDVIYYRQQKEYTDQEFEGSRDLQKEIRKGRITVVERFQTMKPRPVESISEPVVVKQQSVGISSEDIKKAVMEAVAEIPKPQTSTKEIRDIVLDIMQSQNQGIREAVSEALKEKSSQEMKSGDIRKILLEVMADYGKDGQINPNDIRKIVQDVVSQNSQSYSQVSAPGIDDIKKIVQDVLKENKTETGGIAFQGLLQSIVPLIADTVRQEVAKIPTVAGTKADPKSEFFGPEYIPDIQVGDMKSSIKAKERKTTGGDLAGSLAALKKFKKSK